MKIRRFRPRVERLEDRITPATLADYGQLPLSFEINQGQTDSQVQFFTRGSGYAMFLTADSAVLSLTGNVGRISNPSLSDPVSPGRIENPSHVDTTGVAIAVRQLGANPNAIVTGLDALPGTSNYFIGNDPTQWHTNIANYRKVEYQEVYPGIDLVYYGNQSQLEYDYNVAPGADPSQIRFSIEGADRVSLDAQGNLVMHTPIGEVLHNAPILYQIVAGKRESVSGEFVLTGNEVGFAVGEYDRSRELVIDPVLSYSTYLGGSNDEFGFDIAVDGSGNAYVTGYTQSTDFPATMGVLQIGYGGDGDVFVAKLNASGTALLYGSFLGGSGYDRGLGIAVDGSGNAYVTGYTQSTNFPITAGSFQTISGGGEDAFVTKVNGVGDLGYSSYLGGGGNEKVKRIAVDAAGCAFVVGDTNSLNFPISVGAFQTSHALDNGNIDAFVTKVNASATAITYSTYLGGTSADFGNAIYVDAAGFAYVTGATGEDFPVMPGAFQTSHAPNGYAVFVAKLNSTGTGLVYGSYLGGFDSYGYGIAVDSNGCAYVTGQTRSTSFPTTMGAFQTSYAGGVYDVFVTKVNATGTSLVYSTYLGGSDDDYANGIVVNPSGNAYVTGFTASSNFCVTAGAFQANSGGGNDVFLTVLNTLGTSLNYSTYFGGYNNEYGHGIAIDGSANTYVTGYTYSPNFPTTAGALQTNNAANDVFVAKFSFGDATQLTLSVPPNVVPGQPFNITVTAIDAAGQLATGFSGPIQVTSTDANAVLPANSTLINGTGTFSVTLMSAGSQTISVAPYTVSVAYYRFEEGSGASIVDSVGGQTQGSHTATFSTSVPESSISMTGQADNYSLQLNGTSALITGQEFIFHRNYGDATLEFWLNIPNQGHNAIFWTRPNSTDSNRFNIYIGPNGMFGFDYREPNGTFHNLLPGDSTFLVPLNTWTHVAVTRAGNTYNFYKDGTWVYTVVDSSPNLPDTTSWTISGRSPTFTGFVDEVRFVDRALPPEEFLNRPPLSSASQSTTVAPITVTSVVINGAYAAITGASESGNTVTLTTNGNSGFTAGNEIVVAGFAGANSGYNGTWTISSVSGNQVQYTCTNTGLPTLTNRTVPYALSPNTASGLIGNQRSMVNSVAYTFNMPVNLEEDAITMGLGSATTAGNANLALGAPNTVLTPLNGGLIWVVTWSIGDNNIIIGRSIADGVYTITLNSASVTAVSDNSVMTTSRPTDTFYRLFGDITGFGIGGTNARVNNFDSNQLSSSYLKSTGMADFRPGLDFNGDGSLTNIDTNPFSQRYLSTWSAFTPTI